MDDSVYKPCKKCGATDYDNCDQPDFDYTPDGKLIVEPVECDKCNFELLLSPSNEVH